MATLGKLGLSLWKWKSTKGQYSLVHLNQARLVSSLLYGTRAMLVLNLLAFKSEKYTDYVWQNPDQGRTNQNAWIYLKTYLAIFFFLVKMPF